MTNDLKSCRDSNNGNENLTLFREGDLMGPSVSGLDSLLRMPTGCGEQNMIGMAPDVFVTAYLTATNQLSGDISEKAIGFMEHGALLATLFSLSLFNASK